jgi:NAD(P)-dependent dehydrogenase (short-subunit alcohol dehydrogenase family)
VSDAGSRIVLVTGGNRGVGRGIAESFRAAGDRVVVCARRSGLDPQEVLKDGATLPTGPDAELLSCDVRDPDQAAALIQAIVALHGQLDVVVNNAGGSPWSAADTMSPRFAERIVALNLLAPFYVAQAANAVMQKQAGGGVILNIGSVAAFRPSPGTALYNAAKAGLATLTRSLALEWAPKVRVNGLVLGIVNTESAAVNYNDSIDALAAVTPMKRLPEPSEVGGMCVLLTSSAASYVTGTDLVMDGGGEYPAYLNAMAPAQSAQSDQSGQSSR